MRRTTACAVALLSTLIAACDSTTDSRVDNADSRLAMPESAVARTDAEVGTAVQAKYYTDRSVRGRHIDVSVDDGVVTLRGIVDDDAAREHAVAMAREIKGVTQVNDQLQVQALPGGTPEPRAPTTPDTADRIAEATEPVSITANVQASYFLASDLKPSNIDVTTSRDGVVTLEGTVESDAARASAVRIAREAAGVQRVEDRLRVEPQSEGLRTGSTASVPEGQSPDAWITIKVQAKYFVDDEVRARNIDVDTSEGMVTLTGMVGSEAERRQAVAIAHNTEGVRNVTDRLIVDSTMDRDAREPHAPALTDVDRLDPWITTKIQAKYFLDADVKGHDISVDATRGVVTLSGTVESVEQKLEAEQIARETEGVDRVVNQLRVDASGAQ